MSRLLVLSVLALSSPAAVHAAAPAAVATAPGKDPLVKMAVERIAEVEKSEAQLTNGNVAKANQLINRLNWACKRLGAVVQQGTKEWKGAKKRYDALAAKIEAKKKAKAGGGGSAPPKTKTPPKTGGGGAPPKKGGSTPPKAGPTFDFQKLSGLNDSISRSVESLKIVPIRLLLDDTRVRGLQSEQTK